MTHPPLFVFTDRDGTLLDHDTYDHSPALPALNRLKSLDIPVILSSSKTASELFALREKLDLSTHPAIVENGAGLLAAGAEAGGNDSDYRHVRATLNKLPPELRYSFVGFGDMGPEAIAEATGLPLSEATLAGQRQYSEPGLWTGDDTPLSQMLNLLKQEGVHARQGGRFLTFSRGATKADQMAQIAGLYGNPKSLALGDAPNDIEMLTTADYGIIIANPHRDPLPDLTDKAKGKITRTDHAGPTGWNQAVIALLNKLGL